MSIRLIVEFELKAGETDAFVQMLQSAKPNIESVEGCESVEVLLNLETPDRVALSEVWESKELHDQYAERMREAGSMDAMASRLAGPPKTLLFEIK
ncbi:putative quinol monooxygenase [Pseudomaricurvus sp. HS19]|uniref:putative quinol monooxygenase n=1 Tax=Pseudomaricurvus sp. HS19 TaxID=2692626 RepID=UPI001370C2CD|nr:antibiotic biosynthesis monooxygenase family protein [Pseudomaricurvus sp. HS19]MYM63938.1 hypothetical protein [Pseudomaricurvus sp. HS19]